MNQLVSRGYSKLFVGTISNLVHKDAVPTKQGILEITREHPTKILKEVFELIT